MIDSARLQAALKRSEITKSDVIVAAAAFAFLGAAFLCGALIKSKKAAAIIFSCVTVISIAFVYLIHRKFVDAELIDSLGGNFLFGSMVVGTAAAMAISYPARFVAGFLAGMAWRAPSKSTSSATLTLLAAVVYFAGTAPLKDAKHHLIDAQGRIEAKLEFYDGTTKALHDLRKGNPDLDLQPLWDVMKAQVRSVTHSGL
jgi:hypothetical protein